MPIDLFFLPKSRSLIRICSYTNLYLPNCCTQNNYLICEINGSNAFKNIRAICFFNTDSLNLNNKALMFKLSKATPRFELGDNGFAIHGLTTWLCRHNDSSKLSYLSASHYSSA